VADRPLLVFGPRSLDYDFGASHPLTPRRFGPGIDLLRSLGAEPAIEPEPATDEELLLVHRATYLGVVKAFSEAGVSGGWVEPEAGIGLGDNPPFAGMHEASAAVAGVSLRAISAILRGDAVHAFHPGGGLHHAMAARASGFCIYDDPALAIARARRDGLRVLYIDLDVHHGDGVEAIHAADPGVLTISFHESGRYLFPGTGFADELGDDDAAGSVVNVPFEPSAGEDAWLAAVRSLGPELAAAFAPDVVVSQHGSDTHGWDPLAHLRVTTTAMGEAARLVDAIAHRFAGGRWLATGGGGYGVYDVVPRAWAGVWLAGSHAGSSAPERVPAAWHERWVAEAARFGVRSLPERFDDEPNLGEPVSASQALAERQSRLVAETVRRAVVPRLVREAVDRGWWSPLDGSPTTAAADPGAVPGSIEIRPSPDRATLETLPIDPRLVAGLAAEDLRSILRGAGEELRVVAAIGNGRLVGLAAVTTSRTDPGIELLVAVGVTPVARRRGVAGRLMEAAVGLAVARGRRLEAEVALGERDPVEPLDRSVRAAVARRLLERAGFSVEPATDLLGRIDPAAIVGRR
jgi:acetoin utilization protein AcuC